MFRQLIYEAEFSSQHPEDAPVLPNLTTPDAVKELVARRVSRLPDDVIRFLHAAAVAGPECEANIVAAAAELTAEQRLDALDCAVESRLLRRIGGSGEQYAFSHALVRDAIYGELLRGRRVRYHHRIAVATESAHADSIERHIDELAHHYYQGAALADAAKAIHYSHAAGEQALRLLAFEEAVGHFQHGLEVTELYGDFEPSVKCDALLALAEAQNKAGDKDQADRNFERAAAIARNIRDAARLASAAFRAGPMSYIGIVGANADQVRLLEEARGALSEEDSHLRAMVTARLSLVLVYETGVPEPEMFTRSLALSTEAIAMARRLGDRVALGYALNARLHALWGIEPAPERLAIGTELGQIADDVGDEVLAIHGHLWKVRELLAQGDVDAVNEQIGRFDARDTGPRDPLAVSFNSNVQAMMALVRGDMVEGERLASVAVECAEGYNELALSFYGVLLAWCWWQQDRLPDLEASFREILDESPADYPIVQAALALLLSELGRGDEAIAELDRLAELGWETVSDDQTEGVSLAYVAAACGNLGHGRPRRRHLRAHAPLRGHRHRRAGAGVGLLRAGRPLPGAAGVGLRRRRAGRGPLRDRPAHGPTHGGRTVHRGGSSRVGPHPPPGRPGGRPRAHRLAPPECRGVGPEHGTHPHRPDGGRARLISCGRWPTRDGPARGGRARGGGGSRRQAETSVRVGLQLLDGLVGAPSSRAIPRSRVSRTPGQSAINVAHSSAR